MRVLKNREEITQARNKLRSLGASAIDPGPVRWARDLGLIRGIKVGEQNKSWDILQTVEFIKERLALDAPILDIGSYASEILQSLHKLGYSNLSGVDLDPAVMNMPNAGSIKYSVSDFMSTPYPDQSFAAITSISVIEHGYAPAALFAEVSRLLKPGGYFICSFDYWPEKIDTSTVTFFGMDWLIFSGQDIEQLAGIAATHGLEPTEPLVFDKGEPLIECAGKKYSFGWLALKKR
jgi:SAM-dependent methyltransferase